MLTSDGYGEEVSGESSLEYDKEPLVINRMVFMKGLLFRTGKDEPSKECM